MQGGIETCYTLQSFVLACNVLYCTVVNCPGAMQSWVLGLTTDWVCPGGGLEWSLVLRLCVVLGSKLLFVLCTFVYMREVMLC